MLVNEMKVLHVGASRIYGENSLLACYVFDTDITPVFPFIHAHTTKVRRRKSPPYVRFAWEGRECVLREIGALAGHFSNAEEAEEYGNQLLKLINSTYRERASIVPDEPDRAPPTVLEILRTLPMDNCGKCGKASCMAFAASVSLGEVSPWDCPFFPRPKRGRFQFQGGGAKEDSWFELDLDLPSEQATMPLAVDAGGGRGSEEEGSNGAPFRIDLADLTAREVQVLELMALGFTNREIADQLKISPHTVKTHVNHIFEKLDVTDRTQAGVWASRCGLV